MSHTHRESQNPRLAGYCACGVKMPDEKLEILEEEILAAAKEIDPLHSPDTFPPEGHQFMTSSTDFPVRTFESGATRDTDDGKLDYEGFLSPLVLKRFAEYMHKHRLQSDGTLRASDNWQRGIPMEELMKSAFRHFMEWWELHRDREPIDYEEMEDAICALLFNAMAYLHGLRD